MSSECQVPGCGEKPCREVPDYLVRLNISLCSFHVDHLKAAHERLCEDPLLQGDMRGLREKALLREAQSLLFPSAVPRLNIVE